MAQVALRIGAELTVRREVRRRVAELETAAIIGGARARPTAPEWEDVRRALGVVVAPHAACRRTPAMKSSSP